MIIPDLPGHADCCGCAACRAVCRQNAIAMHPNDEGFLMPVVDKTKCIGCRLCENVCPVRNVSSAHLDSATVYAARAKNNDIRLESSSGGIFTLLARKTLKRGGVVFGAACDMRTGYVHHIAVESEEGLERLRGSKYVQSDVGDTYRNAYVALMKGRAVLFSGTPCQIAAFRSYLGRTDARIFLDDQTDQLMLVDVICHAVPSPLAWKKYLDAREAALAKGRVSARAEGKRFWRISFRRKNCGWKRYSMSLRFANDMEYLKIAWNDTFFLGFQRELYNRLSCSHCASREGRSGSDLTLADYWRVHEKFPEMDDDTGTSLVLVHTVKGADLFAAITEEVDYVKSDLADAIRTNAALIRSSPVHPKRKKFFALLRQGDPFDDIVTRLLRRPLWKRCGSSLLGMIRKMVGE